jgi:hypothetical protein
MTGSTAMKIAHRISLLLIAIPLVATLWSSLSMILYVVPEHARIHDEGLLHEIGFARLTLAAIGLLILFIPYRKGERWALEALAIMTICYEVPAVFFLSTTHLGSWPIFRNLPQPQLSGLATVNFERYFFTILAFAGLALAVPQFVRRHGNTRTRDTGTP